MVEVFLLIAGIGCLWLGSELAIQGLLDIGKRFQISQTFMGLTILAFGTDLPELFINISASIKYLSGVETSGLILGQTIGSSFSQIGLMLGILGLLTVVKIKKKEFKRDGFVLVISVFLLFLLGYDGQLSRTDGFILIIVYCCYFVVLVQSEQIHKKFVLFKPRIHMLWSSVSIASGFILLIFGSQLTVDNALILSSNWGIAQRYVGLLIVGLGTSIPELATSVAAVRHGAQKMAAMNLLGSTIFDILFTLGISSSISGLLVHPSLLAFDIPALGVFCMIVFLLLLIRSRLDRRGAFVLLGLYLLYYFYEVSKVVTIT